MPGRRIDGHAGPDPELHGKTRLPNPYLSVIIPAFDEEARIGRSLDELTGYLHRQPYSWEVLVVDDGSSDGTAAVVRDKAEVLTGVRLESIDHAGKGWAVRRGMLAATGELRFMADADFAMPVEQIGEFVEAIEEGYDLVIGSREVAGARRFNEPSIRHLMGRAFNWLVRALAVRRFQDTQCGFKCFRGDVDQQLFDEQRVRCFGFDVEILYLALKRGCRVLELPINWYYQSDSKVRYGVDSFAMLRDTLSVRVNGLLGRYRPAAGPVETDDGA